MTDAANPAKYTKACSLAEELKAAQSQSREILSRKDATQSEKKESIRAVRELLLKFQSELYEGAN